MVKEYILPSIIAYLIGTIPSGLIISKIFRKKDVRKYGSGNIGATNVLRVSGFFIGFTTLLCDVLKGLSTVMIALVFETKFVTIYGLACVSGHIFPIWLNWKGGKGVATALGLILGLSPLAGILMSVVWLTTLKIFKFASVSSLISLFICIVFISVYYDTNYQHLITIYIIILYRHKDNIIRLYYGEENKIIY